MSEQKPKVQASDHDSYLTYTVVSLFIPLVGFILGAIMLTKDEKIDRKVGEHAIVTSVLGLIAWGILWFAYVNWTASQTVQTIPY